MTSDFSSYRETQQKCLYIHQNVYNKKVCKESSGFKSIGRSSRGPGLDSNLSRGSSQPPATAVQGTHHPLLARHGQMSMKTEHKIIK